MCLRTQAWSWVSNWESAEAIQIFRESAGYGPANKQIQADSVEPMPPNCGDSIMQFWISLEHILQYASELFNIVLVWFISIQP